MRHLTSAVAALAIVPALVVLPTVTRPAPSAHPVAPKIVDLPVAGVDAAALQAVVGTTALADRTAAAGRAPAVLTAARGTAPFSLVGLTWDASVSATGLSASVRLREHGTWSGWQPLPPMDTGPDAGSVEAARARFSAGTEPLLTDGADGVQVRVDTADGTSPRGLTVHLVDPGTSAADAALVPPVPAASAEAATPQPTIITRAQWGADESLRGGAATYNSTVKALFLHHTAGSNSYTSSQAASQIRAVYAYHTKTLGWNDIAYNFLIDRFGRIYEGRAGSLTRAVRGSHAGGFNADTMGISVMGNFDVAKPPSAVVPAIEKIMAWKSAQYEINPLAKVTLTSEGGGTSRYAAGVRVSVSTLSGHRDVGSTACPGKYLYSSMSTIRSAVASLMKPALPSPTLSATAASYGGAPITLTSQIPTLQRWTLTVRSRCSGANVRVLTGRSTAPLKASWDLKTTAGTLAPPGLYTLSLASTSPVGAAPTVALVTEVVMTATSPASTCSAWRLAGSNRYVNSVLAGRRTFPTSAAVVLVNGAATADSLVAAPLAFKKSAPLLLTELAALPPEVAADISARHARTAWIVGSTGSVSAAVEAQLRTLGVTTITRLAGPDRWTTAAAVAVQVGAPGGKAVLIPGTDASVGNGLAVAGPAARLGLPVLLTYPTVLPLSTKQALTSMHVTSVDVIGGTSAVSAAVLTSLGKAGVTSRVRVAGLDSYATATAVAARYGPSVGKTIVSVASGLTTADAVVAGAMGRLTLLTTPTSLSPVVLTWLTANKPTTVVLIGAPASVCTGTLASLNTAVAR